MCGVYPFLFPRASIAKGVGVGRNQRARPRYGRQCLSATGSLFVCTLSWPGVRGRLARRGEVSEMRVISARSLPVKSARELLRAILV